MGMELGLVGAGRFGGNWKHLGVKKSKKVQFLTIFWIFLSPLLGAFGIIYIKELLYIYLPTSTFFIWVKKRDFNTPPLVVSLWKWKKWIFGQIWIYQIWLNMVRDSQSTHQQYLIREHKYMTSEDFRGFDTIYHINHTIIIFWLTIGISIVNDVISLQILDKWHFSNGRENVSSYTSSIPAYQSSVPEWLWLTKMLLCSVKYL